MSWGPQRERPKSRGRHHASAPSGSGVRSDGKAKGMRAESHGVDDLDVLLSSLRGAGVPGAHSNVAFLCQKFSGLVNRLRDVEADRAAERKRFESLSARLSSLRAEEDTERKYGESELVAARQEHAALSAEIAEARAASASAESELRAEKLAVENLTARRAELDQRYTAEVARAADATTRAKQREQARVVAEQDLQRLQSQLDTLTVEYDAAAAELAGCRERSSREQARLRELEALLVDEEGARRQSEETALAQREELCSTLRQLALLKERLAETQNDLVRCEDEIHRKDARHKALRTERQKREGQLLAATQKAKSLQGAEGGLQQILADTAEVSSALDLERREARQALDSAQSLQKEVAEVKAQVQERSQRLAEAESTRQGLREELRVAEEEQANLSSTLTVLEHDTSSTQSVCHNLQSEIKLLVSESESLSRERDDFLTERDELRRKLHFMGPSLAEAKRHCRELEDRAEAAAGDVTLERQLREKLQREAELCREKARAVKQRSLKLTERAQSLDGQVQRVSVSGDSFASSMRRSPRPGQTMVGGRLVMSPARSVPQSDDRLDVSSAREVHKIVKDSMFPNEEPVAQVANGGTVGVPSLQYLRHWIEAEEARLGIQAAGSDAGSERLPESADAADGHPDAARPPLQDTRRE